MSVQTHTHSYTHRPPESSVKWGSATVWGLSDNKTHFTAAVLYRSDLHKAWAKTRQLTHSSLPAKPRPPNKSTPWEKKREMYQSTLPSATQPTGQVVFLNGLILPALAADCTRFKVIRSFMATQWQMPQSRAEVLWNIITSNWSHSSLTCGSKGVMLPCKAPTFDTFTVAARKRNLWEYYIKSRKCTTKICLVFYDAQEHKQCDCTIKLHMGEAHGCVTNLYWQQWWVTRSLKCMKL